MLITHTIQVSHRGEWVACLGPAHKHNPSVNSSFNQPVISMPALPAKQGLSFQTKPVVTVMKPHAHCGTKGCAHPSPFVMCLGASATQELSRPCFLTVQLLSQGWRLPCHTPPRARWQGAWVKGQAAVPKPRSDQAAWDSVGLSGGSQPFSRGSDRFREVYVHIHAGLGAGRAFLGPESP